MVVLSPAFAAMTTLLALAGSSNVEAHPMGSNPQELQQRKYMQPHGAPPSRRFKAAQPVWSRNKGSAGTGEARFATRANSHRPHKYSYQKRSGFVQASKCKRDDATGPSSIPGYVLVSTEGEPHGPSRGHPKEHREGSEDLGNIIVHTVFNVNGTETNSTSKADNQYEELERLQLLDATATNFTLRASKEERSLLYIVPADANQQKNLGQIVGVNKNESAISDIVLDTVTVNLVAPLLNGTATAQNWCATFSTVPPAPLHLEPCTYAPGFVGEKSSQRFQFSPRSGSLLPLFVQEQPGNVATGSWTKPEKNTSSNGRQQNQLGDDDDDDDDEDGSAKESTEGVSIVASTTHANSFAVSTVEHKTLNLTFVPASSQPPLPIPDCGGSSSSSSSASGVPVPVSTSKSSSWTPTSSIHHHSKSSISSSIGSLKPSRHSHYTSPTATSTAAVSNITAIASPSSVVSSSASHHHHHTQQGHNSSSIAVPTLSSSVVNTSSAVPTSSHSHDHHHSASESSASHHNTVVAPVESAPTGWESTSSWAPVSSSAVPSNKPTESSSVPVSLSSVQSAEPTSKPIESSATAPKSSAVPSNSSSVPTASSTSLAATASRVEESSSAVPTSAPSSSVPSSVAPSSSIELAPESTSVPEASSSAAPSGSAPTEKPVSTSAPSSSVEAPSSSASEAPTPSASSTPVEDSSDGSSSGLLWAVPA